MKKARVSDMVTSSGSWDWNSMACLLPLYVCEYSKSIPIPSTSAGPDSIAWSPSHDGDFSVKSSYLDLLGFAFLKPNPLFKLVH